MEKVLFLDRDGVINRDKGYISEIDDIDILLSRDFVEFLNNRFDYIYIVTNQSGISRGLFSKNRLSEINKFIIDESGIEVVSVEFCPHLPEDNCECRKPKGGLIQRIQMTHPNARFFIIGDKWSDMRAAHGTADNGYYIYNNLYPPKKLVPVDYPVTVVFNLKDLENVIRRDFA